MVFLTVILNLVLYLKKPWKKIHFSKNELNLLLILKLPSYYYKCLPTMNMIMLSKSLQKQVSPLPSVYLLNCSVYCSTLGDCYCSESPSEFRKCFRWGKNMKNYFHIHLCKHSSQLSDSRNINH